MYQKPKAMTWVPWITLLILTSGCEEEDSQVAREAANRQAEQNMAMAELNQEVASGTRRLVEADAQARKEVIGVHHDLLAERTQLNASWNALDQERRTLAGQLRTESLLAPVIQAAALISVAAVMLGFCWYALVAIRRGDDTDAQLNELLLGEVLSNEPPLVSRSQHIPSLLGQTQLDKSPSE